MTQPPNDQPPPMCSIAWWRQSKWNATKCVPVLMTVQDARFSGIDRHGEAAFDTPTVKVSGHVSKLGTLVLSIGGRKTEFVGRQAELSPDPSEQQREGFRAFVAAYPALPYLERPTGAADYLFNESASYHMHVWATALRAHGAAIS